MTTATLVEEANTDGATLSAIDAAETLLDDSMRAAERRMPRWIEDAYRAALQAAEPEELAGPKRWYAGTSVRIRNL
jgi:hypothetical protein